MIIYMYFVYDYLLVFFFYLNSHKIEGKKKEDFPFYFKNILAASDFEL